MSKPKLKFVPNDRGHYFASSVFEWRTSADLSEVITKMTRLGLPFNLYYVPLPPDAEYKISGYAPQVEGVVLLGSYVTEGE